MKGVGYSNYFMACCLLAAGLMSCEVINPDEDIPAYIYVTEFQLETDANREGSNSERITEAWLSVDGAFLGAYSLPALVPVLTTGEREISLQAGIRDNGISTTPEVYPFYETFRTTLNLSPNKVDTIRPNTSYSERTRFAFIDDFDRGATLFQDIRIGSTENAMRAVENMVFEGQASGRIRLDPDNPAVELATVTRYDDLTENSPFVYLEVNYKSDVPVVFGLIGYQGAFPSPGTPLFDPGFRAREEWNKIYFNLSPLIANSNFDEFQVALQAVLPGDAEMEEAFIWLDNIKLLHF